jgi:hypothetical protein
MKNLLKLIDNAAEFVHDNFFVVFFLLTVAYMATVGVILLVA